MIFRDFGDELTDALLIHGAGTKILLEKAGPIDGGAAGILKNLAVEASLTPAQLAAKRAADAADAAAALVARNKWIVSYIKVKQSFPLNDCSVSPCAPLYLTPAEVASFIVQAFPPGSWLRAKEGNSGIDSGSIWYVEAPGRRRHLMDMNVWRVMGSGPIIDVDSNILLSLPFSVDLRAPVGPPPPPPPPDTKAAEAAAAAIAAKATAAAQAAKDAAAKAAAEQAAREAAAAAALLKLLNQPPALPALPACFTEAAYLAVNPDVAKAVGGGMPSGAWHWQHYGSKEGRNPCPVVSVPPPPKGGGGGGGGGGGKGKMRGYGYFHGDLSYTVKPGDTMTGIALAHGLCQKGPGNTQADWQMCMGAARNIAIASGIDPAMIDQLSVGQQLVIPEVDVAVTQGGDGNPVAVAAVAKKTPSGVLWAGGLLAGFLIYKSLFGRS